MKVVGDSRNYWVRDFRQLVENEDLAKSRFHTAGGLAWYHREVWLKCAVYT